MKEDYLWDKTGEDAEIQGLENALKAFRYTETAPPELPAKVFAVEKPKRAGFFQFRFAFAALAAVVVILSVVWFQATNNKIPPVESVAEINVPKTVDKIADEEIIQTPESAPVENRKPSVKPHVVRVRQRSAPIVNTEKAILLETKVKEPAETLTAEEKYAYDQLMLALSITGSKLKIVKDKINGIEEQNAVLDTTK
jgi:hypothetical protein